MLPPQAECLLLQETPVFPLKSFPWLDETHPHYKEKSPLLKINWLLDLNHVDGRPSPNAWTSGPRRTEHHGPADGRVRHAWPPRRENLRQARVHAKVRDFFPTHWWVGVLGLLMKTAPCRPSGSWKGRWCGLCWGILWNRAPHPEFSSHGGD